MYSVYALVDPRDQAIRYVGMSKNVWRRYATHLLLPSRSAPAKNAWVEELKVLDLSPLLAILETTETEEEAFERETYWILHHLDQGARLFNVAKTGRQIPIIEGDSDTARIARGLKVPEGSILKLIRAKKIPAHKVGNQWEVDPVGFQQWLDSCSNGYPRRPAQES